MIELRNIKRQFGQTTVLEDISLTVENGSFTTLLGASGSGKSTTLRIIAGLDTPTSGSVMINGQDVTQAPAAARNIAMVFQSYALYPHMDVRGNITLPLAMRNMNRLERAPLLNKLLPSARQKAQNHQEQVESIARMLEIEHLLARKPSQLSGGQKQRVAMGRALVRDPVAFLLDEPLSNLDAKLRGQMRGELIDLHKRTGKTFIYVTHDQAEAMSMSDQIAIFMHGVIVQKGTPHDLYERPATKEVAAFIGDHPINFIECSVEGNVVRGPLGIFVLDEAVSCQNVVIGVRPEVMELSSETAVNGKVERVEYFGSKATASLSLSNGQMIQVVLEDTSTLPETGSACGLSFELSRAHVFDAQTGLRLDVKVAACVQDAAAE
ncbi:ABC transporter ATP-binding protein [Rhodobacteraceae bacterium RKSG542]|uniref:ABC transporter ATP-binding protein n=1 Tax=Pseudovibrio flavus TaxID=2529854 RepID=UPI0012BD57D8|nr:ABC transporter ATP-binding protein [Pseudovibrio flavus]MTI15951.1 ABC transporter ATP-binding protein [Pseudovibrio flavus]